ncbi:50S ribosomal protein L4 [Batrachochytrium salamandrivorans]|nr:50S ribosomal protein L4 [Batrachochytrium salamandrivorans]
MLFAFGRRGFASSTIAVNRFLKTPIQTPAVAQIPINLQLIDPAVMEHEIPFKYEQASKLVKEDFTIPMYYGPFTPGLCGEEFPEPIALAQHVFQTEIRPDIMSRVVRWQRSMWQQGTHKTKGKGEVSGRGAKPYRQKGTGLARQGNTRNPHMRGGGVAFGQQVRSHAHKMNRRERRFGLRSALATRFQESQLFVCNSLNPIADDVDVEFEVEEDISQYSQAKQVNMSLPLVQSANAGQRRQQSEVSLKTLAKEQRTDYIADLLEEFCEKLNITKVLILDHQVSEDLIEAIKKVETVHIDYQDQSECNVYEILHKRQVLISKPALLALQSRLDEQAIRQAKWQRKGFVEFLANPDVERVRVPGRLRNKQRPLPAPSKPYKALNGELLAQFDARQAKGHCVICDSAGHHSSTCTSPGSAALWSEAESYFANKLK